MAESSRVFIAIAVPEPIERNLARLQTELAPAIPECRWTSAMPFHLTLAFLGEITKTEQTEVCRAVESSVKAIEPFEIEVAGLGAFPTAVRPRVVWAGVNAGNTTGLVDLHGSVVNALGQMNLRPDDQRFHPHVTLGRIKTPGCGRTGFTRLAELHLNWSAGRHTVENVSVFSSVPGPTGSVYRVLRRCALASKKTEGHA